MSAPDQNSRRAARKFAARDGIKYTAARRVLIALGHWGRGGHYYDHLIAEMDAQEVSLADLVKQQDTNDLKGEGR